MGPRMAIAALALTIGCTPLEGGAGSGTTAESVGSDGSSSPSTTDDPAPSTTAGDTTDAGSSADETSSPQTTSTTDGTDGSSGEPPCGDADTDAMFAEDGELESPMELYDSLMLGMMVAFSPVAEEGLLTFEIDTRCEGPLYLWGLVWDFEPGTVIDNPDSYYVTIDGGDEIVWEYGCGTEASAPSSWTWVQVGASQGGCDGLPHAPSLAPGTHTIVIRNREEGMGTNIASIAGIAFSHDPSMDPAMFLDPP